MMYFNWKAITNRSSHWSFSIKKAFLKNYARFARKQQFHFLIKLQGSGNFIKTETLPKVFSCEFCKIFKNTIFTEHVRKAASEQIL